MSRSCKVGSHNLIHPSAHLGRTGLDQTLSVSKGFEGAPFEFASLWEATEGVGGNLPLHFAFFLLMLNSRQLKVWPAICLCTDGVFVFF